MDENRKVGRRYLIFFGVICLVFIGLMGVVYRVTRRANPIMLDEHGKASPTR